MDKILTAKDILKAKGYNIKLKFNIENFARVIGEWFMENKASSQIVLLPYRFADLNNAPDCGFAELAGIAGTFGMADILKIIPRMDGVPPYPFVIDRSFADEAAKNLQATYGYKVKKGKKGYSLISLI